ncbi:PDZ domain-containing protein [Vagococcus sp. DIV0080]|uniref:endopeptidase La n=1 Tax=Candidatus Vagococcus giribetii TaxID=2230876 RepID=A0ABS3HTU4_9ENTE|nr:SepM family pheromone-processing serine protease [Vagococcus sp. DIV0080]MBO0477086.1 PDZ domain-containing protein [Vagococcus sp. DIV0080]
MKKINIKWLIVAVLGILVFFFLPLPYFIEMPGTAEDLRDHVTVNGKSDDYKGSFMLTTVAVQQGTPFNLLTSYFDPSREIVSKKEMMGSSSSEEYNQMQSYYMESSQNFASKVALDLTDKPYDINYKGVYVMSINEESDFKGKLTIGSTITHIEGKPITSSEELIKTVQNKKPGDTVTLTVEEDKETKEVSGKLVELKETKKTGIGISLVDHTSLESKDKIEFQTKDIGGPSAGLMFTLELYSLLAQKDIRHGLEIAGTGTINSKGEVGRIGGIDKKVIAAEYSGADVFFAPDDDISPELKKKYPDIKTNYEEAVESAKKNKLKLTIVPVKTAQDAVDYLEKRK